MSHGTDYNWKVTEYVNFLIPSGESIVSANLSIYGLNNWYEPENDYMNVYLIDNKVNINSLNWNTKVLLDTYSDINGGKKEDYSYDLSQDEIDSLTSYLSDGRFGLGFDPNCHYSDTSMKFTIETRVPQTPEPSSMILFGFGLLSLVGIKRKI